MSTDGQTREKQKAMLRTKLAGYALLFAFLLAGPTGVQASPQSVKTNVDRPTVQESYIQASVFRFWIEEFTRATQPVEGSTPFFLAVAARNSNRKQKFKDPSRTVMRHLGASRSSARPFSQMADFGRAWRKKHRVDPYVGLIPGTGFYIVSIKWKAPAEVEVRAHYKRFPLGPGDGGEGGASLFRVVRGQKGWMVKKEQQLFKAG